MIEIPGGQAGYTRREKVFMGFLIGGGVFAIAGIAALNGYLTHLAYQKGKEDGKEPEQQEEIIPENNLENQKTYVGYKFEVDERVL